MQTQGSAHCALGDPVSEFKVALSNGWKECTRGVAGSRLDHDEVEWTL